jgi:hypothetical protein
VRTVPFEGIDSFELPPGFFVSGGDPMAAFDSYWGAGKCQNRCVFCLEAKFTPGEHPPFPETATRPRLDLGNWEPTALDDLPGLVRRFKARYSVVCVFTNGRRLDAALAREVTEAGAGEIVISLHGPDARTHDALTRAPGSFAEAVAGCRAAVAAARGGLPRLGVSLVLTRSNMTRLGETLDLAVSLGASALHVSLMVPQGPAARAAATVGPSPEEAFAAFAALARDRGGRPPIPVHLLHFPVCAAEKAPAEEVAVALTPRRGAFETLLAPSWAGTCAACRWAPWCEGMMAAYAPGAVSARRSRSRAPSGRAVRPGRTPRAGGRSPGA